MEGRDLVVRLGTSAHTLSHRLYTPAMYILYFYNPHSRFINLRLSFNTPISHTRNRYQPRPSPSPPPTTLSTMMKLRLHLLRLIPHAPLLPRLPEHRPHLLLAVRRLFILLRQIARLAAARAQTVSTRVALELVLCAHVASREHGEHEGDAQAGEAGEGEALEIG